MKRISSLLFITVLCISIAACGSKQEENSNVVTQTPAANEESQSKETETSEETKTEESETESSVLVVYFSATGNTKAVAEVIAEGTEADLYEITPEEPYTDDDLNWNDNNSRSTVEMNDASIRPVISGTVDNFEQYSTVYIGYPIWWGEAPRILDTFVERYDFTGKTVIPFCTSSSSGLGSSADTLADLSGAGDWKDGKRFGEHESADAIVEWVNGQ